MRSRVHHEFWRGSRPRALDVCRVEDAQRIQARGSTSRRALTWDVAALGSPQLASYAGVVTVTELADVQGVDYSAAPVVILSAKLGGLEDIPPGVAAVLTAAPVDLLSHIAIRARQTGVLLAAMPDPPAGSVGRESRPGRQDRSRRRGGSRFPSRSSGRLLWFFFFLLDRGRAQAHARPQGGHRGLARDSG